MEHKAFVFDFENFRNELMSILEEELSKSSGRLANFISTNLGSLKDPYEGEPLDLNWREMVESEDAHQYGDFAITKYYDPLDDIGIGDVWHEVQSYLNGKESLLLGRTVGPSENPFDPGKMGSYFQSSDDVHATIRLIEENGARFNGKGKISMMFNKAVNKGLYVTF